MDNRNRRPFKKPYGARPVSDAPIRVRLPMEGEMLGTVIATVGGGRLQVQCKDGTERLCRIPGKIRRNIWVRPGDVVILKPWAIEGEKKADVIWRYNHLQVQWLRDRGHLD